MYVACDTNFTQHEQTQERLHSSTGTNELIQMEFGIRKCYMNAILIKINFSFTPSSNSTAPTFSQKKKKKKRELPTLQK
jgi:hypothetical protein